MGWGAKNGILASHSAVNDSPNMNPATTISTASDQSQSTFGMCFSLYRVANEFDENGDPSSLYKTSEARNISPTVTIQPQR